MENILALKRERANYIQELTALVGESEKQGRPLNEEESKKWDGYYVKAEDLKNRIEVLEKTAALNRDISQIDKPANKPMPGQVQEGNESGFKSIGEMLHSLRYQPNDSRLQAALDMNVGEKGGYAVPAEFRNTLYMVEPQEAIIRPRAIIIPPGDIPDQEVQFPALNQSSNENMYGGVEIKWTKSGTTKPETDFTIRKIALKPEEMAGFIEVPDNLLRNWSACSALIERLFRGAHIAAEDTAFYKGDGVGKPKGVLNSGALLAVNRAVANTIAYADVKAMYSKFKFGGAGVWVGSQSILTQLMSLKDEANQLIWQPNAREGAPGVLFGIPLLFNERSAQLGSKGDLMLCDFQYYLIKDGSGPFIATSEHVKFKDNITVIKFFGNTDGQSWLSGPIVQEGGYQVSPFVALDVPA